MVSRDPLQLLKDLGLDPVVVTGFEAPSNRHGHAIYCVLTAGQSYVTKWLLVPRARWDRAPTGESSEA